MSSIPHTAVTPVLQPYRPPPLNLAQALPLPPPPAPLANSGAMTFDIHTDPTAFAVHSTHPPPLSYHAPLPTHRTPSLSDAQLNQHHQHQHQQLSHHVQTTPAFHAQQDPDGPLKKRQRLQYDQNHPVHDVYPGQQQHQATGGITTPSFSERQQEAQLGPSSTPVQTPMSAVYPNGLRSGLPTDPEAGYYRREYRMHPQPDTESEQDQRSYLQSQSQTQSQSEQHDHLPPPHANAFVYPPHDRNASAAYPSHIPHLNQPVPQASPVFGSVAQGQGYEVHDGQGGYEERYHPEYTLPAPAAASTGSMGTGSGGYYSTGYAGQPFSPVVPPLPGHGPTGHLDIPGTRSGYSSAYGSVGSTATGQWAETAGQYTMVHPNPPSHHSYSGQGPASYRGTGNSPDFRLPYLPPVQTGRGLPNIDPVEDRKRSKFSSGSESLASPVYHSGSSSNRPYAARRPDMEADSGWSAEPSSSTTKMSSSLPAEGSGSTGNKGKRKTSGSTSGGKSQPVFVTKLFTMLEDPAIARSGLLKWSQDGAGFICTNPTEFARLVLPQFFKHNNWHSFVRQLNMYGFSKQVNDVFLTLTTPSAVPMAWEFRHATFRRDDPEGIASIKRRSVKQTNQLRLQMEAEAAARHGPYAAAYARHTAYAQASAPLVKSIKQERPSTTSPALSTTSASHRYAAVRYSHPTESGGFQGLQGYAMHSAPVYPNETGSRSAIEGGLPASFSSAWPRYVSHMPTSAGAYDTYRTPISATGSQYYPQPLSSASAVSQYPVLQPMGEPPVYQSMPYYEPDRPYVQSLARQAGSISSQANHLAHEQEALKQNAQEIKQETGVILDSLSVSVDANQALPDARTSRLREGIERLQDKVSEREKRVSASLASSENIAARAHALQVSLVAAASTTTLPNDGRGVRPVNYASTPNAWPSEYDTLPPLQQPHYDTDDRHTRTTPIGQHKPAMPNKQESYRTTRSESVDDDSGSERSHSRTRSGSGSGGIKELLN